MIDNYGTERVIEPKGATPVTAWKINNSSSLKDDEALIKISLIQFEADCFEQFYASCEYEENLVKSKIKKIVDERGKLHNPYTESSGLFVGTIVRAGKDFGLEEKGLNIGDEIICTSPLAGLPIILDSVDSLHYYYDQADVTGYAICFKSSQLKKYDKSLPLRPLLKAIDEGSTFLTLLNNSEVKNFKNVAFVGGTMATIALYSSFLRKFGSDELKITLITDNSYLKNHGGKYVPTDFSDIFSEQIDDIIFVDVDDTINAQKEISDSFDCVFVLEHLPGSGALAAMLVSSGGTIWFITLNNSCNVSLLLADASGKEFRTHTIGGYKANGFDFAVSCYRESLPQMLKVDAFYQEQMEKNKYVPKLSHIKESLSSHNIDDYAFSSPKTREMLDSVLNIAKYDCNVIIQGETGSGKEKVFDIIHSYSQRNDKPCIRINCATIQPALAESEFFGYEKGSFTGALSEGKIGYFEMANNGTLFLDEIGSLSLDMQAKLLRVLQDSSFYKVGGTSPVHVNVRIVAANNVPLKKLVAENKFREDLFYRLNICEINVPPLRERIEDIRSLSDLFIKNFSKKYGIEKSFEGAAYRELEKYHWPGNVRELENAVHRLFISCRGNTIDKVSVDMILNDNAYLDCVMDIRKDFNRHESINFESIMEEQEKLLIEYALKKEKTTRKAADLLGLPQATFARKKIKYGL